MYVEGVKGDSKYTLRAHNIFAMAPQKFFFF